MLGDDKLIGLWLSCYKNAQRAVGRADANKGKNQEALHGVLQNPLSFA